MPTLGFPIAARTGLAVKVTDRDFGRGEGDCSFCTEATTELTSGLKVADRDFGGGNDTHSLGREAATGLTVADRDFNGGDDVCSFGREAATGLTVADRDFGGGDTTHSFGREAATRTPEWIWIGPVLQDEPRPCMNENHLLCSPA